MSKEAGKASILSRRRWRKFVSSRRQRFLRWVQHTRRFPGLPPGLDVSTVNDLCLEHLGEPLRRASYTHASGWKALGAYGLLLRGAGGSTWRLIYKDAEYSSEQIPALGGLPLRPGPPEYLVYNQPHGPLADYLPTVYSCIEVVPGRHYRYLLEDLREEYQRLSTFTGAIHAENVVQAVRQLPTLYGALEACCAKASPAQMLDFGTEFSTGLLGYARRNLEQSGESSSDETVSRVLGRWAQLSEVYLRPGLHEDQSGQLIHGDCHTGHIYVRRDQPAQIKVIDWEWAGRGRPHYDLAALLESTKATIEEEALASYADQQGQISLAEHKLRYEWCQMQRGLLTAAFLARQQAESPRRASWVPIRIRRALERVLLAEERLRQWGA